MSNVDRTCVVCLSDTVRDDTIDYDFVKNVNVNCKR